MLPDSTGAVDPRRLHARVQRAQHIHVRIIPYMQDLVRRALQGICRCQKNARVGLGLSGASGCFNSGGAFVNTCGQSYDGLVTLTTSSHWIMA